MRVVFIGSGAIGVPTLRALSKEHEVIAVFTRPDRPAGRGYQLRPTPIKLAAQELGLPIHQPEDINAPAVLGQIRELAPDVIVVASFGQILTGELLRIPRLGAINLHASLLPKYRGAAPIQWALIRGEQETGVTTFLMDEGMDTGPILLQRRVEITPEDDAGSIEEKLAKLGAEVVLETLEGLAKGELEPQPQDHSAATYAPKLKKAHEKLDWARPARELVNLIRALSPRPGAFTLFRGKRLKIYKAKVVGLETEQGWRARPGEILGLGEEGPLVKTGTEALELLEVQPEGKRRMSGPDFARGYRITAGELLE